MDIASSQASTLPGHGVPLPSDMSTDASEAQGGVEGDQFTDVAISDDAGHFEDGYGEFDGDDDFYASFGCVAPFD